MYKYFKLFSMPLTPHLFPETRSVSKFINYISKYNKTDKQLNSQKRTLQHQQSTRTHKTIPKQRLPILPTVSDRAAQTEVKNDFRKQYKKLYFSFLDRIITHAKHNHLGAYKTKA